MDDGRTPGRFAAAYRRHVTPVLKREAARLGTELADDLLSFSDAMAELLSLAWSRGAGHLPEPLREELGDWLAATLLDETDLAEEAMALVQSLLREPSRDVMRARIREYLDDG